MKEDFVLKDTDQHVQPERLEDLQFLVLIDPAFHHACVPHTGRVDYRSIMRSTGTAYFSRAPALEDTLSVCLVPAPSPLVLLGPTDTSSLIFLV